jgi:hypothetical protein
MSETNITLSDSEAEAFIKFQRFYPQFIRMVNQNVFERDFTGRVILDLHNGEIKNLQKITNIHFTIQI